MTDIVINSNILIFISVVIFIIVVAAIIYIINRDRKQDKDEIEDLLNSISKEEPKIKKQQKIEKNEAEELSEIELVLNKMQKNLEAKPEEVVATFEKEQEEKAIISYQELVKTLKKGNDENVVKIEDHDLENSELSIEDTLNLEEMVQEIKNPKKETKQIIKNNEKFKNTEFISPVYGKMNEHLEYPKIKNFKNADDLEKFDEIYDSYNIEDYLEEFSDNNMKVDSLEQTLDLEPISVEIKKNEEFLKALKDFRENL